MPYREDGQANQHQDQKQRDSGATFIFKGFGKDDIFLRACIVMMFKTIAVKSKKVLKEQVATSVE